MTEVVLSTESEQSPLAIHVKREDLVNALVRLGVVPPDDGLRKRIERLIALAQWDYDTVPIADLRKALDPTPPFEFPKAHAAVIEGLKEDGTWYRYTRIGNTWRD